MEVYLRHGPAVRLGLGLGYQAIYAVHVRLYLFRCVEGLYLRIDFRRCRVVVFVMVMFVMVMFVMVMLVVVMMTAVLRFAVY